jgi:hypothetical protein
MATVGENALTISERTSSYRSEGLLRGLATADLPNRDSDRDSRPLGELERDRLCTRVFVLDAKVEGLDTRMGRLVVDASGDSLRVGDRVLRTLSVPLVEADEGS